jgi:ribonuclease P protein component
VAIINGGGGAAVRGEQHLTKRAQFDLVFDKGRSWAGKEVVIRALPNGLEISRYGFTVSKRVGNAVTRNRIKRRLREILRQTPPKTGWDIIFIARNRAATADYKSLGKTVRNLLFRAGIFMGEYEGVSPGAH